ncbi:MAG: insulinase family protein [Bryobacteraceae bacterium]|nr:insulinase family protein [Bryobacteraceae bacterium]MDW8379799.1 pitrilysin family protein [Bryobacterales bacterium]
MQRNWLRLALIAFVPLSLAGQDLKEFEKNVTEFTLANGLHFIVLKRTQAPVVSMVTHVNVGSANDPAGMTGLAHMFEHMAFKGTDTFGTKNWPEEKKALEEIERIYDQLESEKNKGARASQQVIQQLEADLKAAINKANSYVEKEAYSKIISENGGVQLNAGTSFDSTFYFYSLPANRIELWFFLTSQVFKNPVMREFYAERDVVRNERRMSFESSPQGKLQEALLTTSFIAHPQRSLIGWASDIENLRAKHALEFYKKYYVPSNMVVAIAGDVDPAEIKRLADQYFSSLPSGPTPPRVITEEPPQTGERRVSVESPTQPVLYIGYKRPEPTSPDSPALAVLAGLLSQGRTGILYKELVERKKIALAAGASATFFGSKYPDLFFLYSAPSAGKTVEENERAILEVIERMKREKVDEASLNRIKAQVRAGLVRSLESNLGMALQLASNYMRFGDWRRMFTNIQKINEVTAEDVQRVAKTYLVESARTVVYSKAPSKGEGQ